MLQQVLAVLAKVFSLRTGEFGSGDLWPESPRPKAQSLKLLSIKLFSSVNS